MKIVHVDGAKGKLFIQDQTLSVHVVGIKCLCSFDLGRMQKFHVNRPDEKCSCGQGQIKSAHVDRIM